MAAVRTSTSLPRFTPNSALTRLKFMMLTEIITHDRPGLFAIISRESSWKASALSTLVSRS